MVFDVVSGEKIDEEQMYGFQAKHSNWSFGGVSTALWFQQDWQPFLNVILFYIYIYVTKISMDLKVRHVKRI